MADIFDKLRTIISDPSILRAYLNWTLRHQLGQDPLVRIDNIILGNFPNFNSYLSTQQYAPTKREIEFVSSALKDAETIFDVGGNFGVWTLIFQHIRRHGDIHTFEPNPYTAEILTTNLRRNGCMLEVQQCAIGGSVGTIAFTDKDDLATNKIDFTGQQGLNVPITTLDEYTKSHDISEIDFLKVDVEGAEIHVLEGGRELFQGKKIKSGMIEVCEANFREFGYSTAELVEILYGWGYELIDVEDRQPITPELAKNKALINAALIQKTDKSPISW